MSRLVIIGGPRTGKTTLAAELAKGRSDNPAIRHTDDLIGIFNWHGASQKIADQWLTECGPWIIEGVAAVRGLRKWLRQNPTGKPCDRIILRTDAKVPLTKGQPAMAKGHETIWSGIRAELEARGVVIEVRR